DVNEVGEDARVITQAEGQHVDEADLAELDERGDVGPANEGHGRALSGVDASAGWRASAEQVRRTTSSMGCSSMGRSSTCTSFTTRRMSSAGCTSSRRKRSRKLSSSTRLTVTPYMEKAASWAACSRSRRSTRKELSFHSMRLSSGRPPS